MLQFSQPRPLNFPRFIVWLCFRLISQFRAQRVELTGSSNPAIRFMGWIGDRLAIDAQKFLLWKPDRQPALDRLSGMLAFGSLGLSGDK
jgi:hypothetical protein